MRIRTKNIYEVSFMNNMKGQREARKFKRCCKRNGLKFRECKDCMSITIIVGTQFNDVEIVPVKPFDFFTVG